MGIRGGFDKKILTARRVESSPVIETENQIVRSLKTTLNLLPIRDGNFEASKVEENFNRISEFLRPFGGTIPAIYQIARFFGGLYLEGEIEIEGSGEDTSFPNLSGRLLSAVMLTVDLDGTGGQAFGSSAGTGKNNTAWTEDTVYLRASVTSNYAVILI